MDLVVFQPKPIWVIYKSKIMQFLLTILFVVGVVGVVGTRIELEPSPCSSRHDHMGIDIFPVFNKPFALESLSRILLVAVKHQQSTCPS